MLVGRRMRLRFCRLGRVVGWVVGWVVQVWEGAGGVGKDDSPRRTRWYGRSRGCVDAGVAAAEAGKSLTQRTREAAKSTPRRCECRLASKGSGELCLGAAAWC